MNEDIQKACQILNQGGIILYPTDTVWGLGCDATNEEAVSKLYALKQRMDSHPMLILVDNEVKIEFYVDTPPPLCWDLIELSTTPLTIIYPNARNLAKNLLSSDGTIGIRVTTEAFSKQLCQRFRKAIVSTSANLTGDKTPTHFAEISNQIKESVDYIVTYGQTTKGESKPSSIIQLGAGGQIKIIRS